MTRLMSSFVCLVSVTTACTTQEGVDLSSANDPEEAAIAEASAVPELVAFRHAIEGNAMVIAQQPHVTFARSEGSTVDDWAVVLWDLSRADGAKIAQIGVTWQRGGEHHVVTVAEDESIRDELAAFQAPHKPVADDPELAESHGDIGTEAVCAGMGAACPDGRCSCSPGLTCYGPDHRETCRCTPVTRWSASWRSSTTIHPACQNPHENPVGYGNWVKWRTGCGQGMVADMCGNGIIVPSWTEQSGTYLSCAPQWC